MNYNELKKHAESKRILISEVAEAVGMTSTGFKRSIETESLPISKVPALCSALQISIAEFFGEAPEGGTTIAAEPVPYRSVIKSNLTTDNATIDVLVRHIAWLETEIDRLRGVGGKKRNAAG